MRNSPRSRRTPPAGFIQPCQPTLVAYPPAGPGWLHEIKHDGFRILARKEGERVQVWSRRGATFTYRFPAIAQAVRGLNVGRALIDGEAVVAAAARRLVNAEIVKTVVGEDGGAGDHASATEGLSRSCTSWRYPRCSSRRRGICQTIYSRRRPSK
jgi:hypothetical protein